MDIPVTCNGNAVLFFDVPAHGKTVPIVGFVNNIVGTSGAKRCGKVSGGFRRRFDSGKVTAGTNCKPCTVAYGKNLAGAVIIFCFSVINKRIKNLTKRGYLAGNKFVLRNNNFRFKFCGDTGVGGRHLRKQYAFSRNIGINLASAWAYAGYGHGFIGSRRKRRCRRKR